MSSGNAETVKLNAKTGVRTDLATLYAVVIAAVVIGGGIVSLKRDISEIADAQKTKTQELHELRDDVNRIMFHLLISPSPSTGAKK